MENTRKIIGLTIIFLWSLCIVFILILMAIGLIDVDKGIEILKSFSSVSSGFVGLIIGYYFSKE